MGGNSRSYLVVLVASLIAAAVLGLVSIHVPFGRDQGVAAFVAEVMAKGGVVYKDVYHFNLPGIFFTYWLARLLPLPPVESVNLLHLAFTLLTALAVFAAARKAGGAMEGALAAFFYLAFAVVVYTDYWDVAQKDSLASLPIALALVFLIPSSNGDEPAGAWAILAAGLMSGLAAMYKPTLGIIFLAVLYRAAGADNKRSLKSIIAAAVGFVLAFVPFMAWLAAKGALPDMLESVVRFGGFYGGQNYQGIIASTWEVIRALAGWIFDWRFLAVLAVLGLARGRGDRGIRLAAVAGALLLAQVIIQMKFFTYHWVPLLVPGSILAARGATAFFTKQEGAAVPGWAIALILAALFAGSLAPHAGRYRRELYFDLGRIDRTSFLRPYGRWGGGDICPSAQYAVADYLRENSGPDDPVLVFGHELGLYLLADRFPPTRFAYDQPLVTEPGGNAGFEAMRLELRAEFIRDLDARPPLYVLVIENDATGIEPVDSYSQMRAFPALADMIDNDYALETKIEDYFIYRRLGVTPR